MLKKGEQKKQKKYKQESEKALREFQDSHIKIAQAKGIHDLLELQNKRETLKGHLHELKLQEEKAKAVIDQNKLGHENNLLQQEIEGKKAKIKVYKEMSTSVNFDKAAQRHTALVQQQLKNT